MRLIFYIFLVSQLLNFLVVFAEKLKRNSSEINPFNIGKVEEVLIAEELYCINRVLGQSTS